MQSGRRRSPARTQSGAFASPGSWSSRPSSRSRFSRVLARHTLDLAGGGHRADCRSSHGTRHSRAGSEVFLGGEGRFSPDGAYILTLSRKDRGFVTSPGSYIPGRFDSGWNKTPRTVCALERIHGRELFHWPADQFHITCCAFSPTSPPATGGADRLGRVWT